MNNRNIIPFTGKRLLYVEWNFSNTKISVEYLRGISSIRYDEATDAENTNGRYNVHKVDNTVC